MEFAIVLIGGLVGGLSIPKRLKVVVGALLLAILYVVVVVVYAASVSYRIEDAFAFLLLIRGPDVTEPGLAGLVIGADIWLLGAIVAAVRFALASRKSAASS
jgi:hypothetical protein